MQKLCYPRHTSRPSLLLAAAGPYVLSLDLNTGELLSKWPNLSTASTAQEGGLNGSAQLEASAETSLKSKKRKLNPTESPQSDGSFENRETSSRVREAGLKDAAPAMPNVSMIVSTKDGKTVIAVTADDKCLHVFDIDPQGHLHSLSERHEPSCQPR